MYSDGKKKRGGLLLLLLLIALAALTVWAAWRNCGSDVSREGAEAIREAVRRSALQCYAVEGVYPPNLAYLEENYGLQVNTRDYYVTYDAFASNLPPDIRVQNK